MDRRIDYCAVDVVDGTRSCRRFDALRHLISVGGRPGPGKYEVLKKCGEPTLRAGDTWIYDKPGTVKYVVVFDASGYLARID